MKYFLLLAFALLATPALAQPAYPSFTPETSLSATGTTQATAAPVKTPFVYATISAGNVGVILTNVTQTTVCDASNGAVALVGLLWSPIAEAQNANATFYTPPPNVGVITYGTPITWQASVTLSAATSTTLAGLTANLGTYPALPGVFSIYNSGANPVTICLQGGTCTATTGYVIPSLVGKVFNLTPQLGFPSAISTSGTTLQITNG
jgi:hypothetical protein